MGGSSLSGFVTIFLIAAGVMALVIIAVVKLCVPNTKPREKYIQAVDMFLHDHHFHTDQMLDTDLMVLRFDYTAQQGAYLPFVLWPKQQQTPVSQVRFFPLEKITECMLVQDGTMVHHSAVVSGIAGAALFGLGGAIAGSTAMHAAEHGGHLSVRVLIDDTRINNLTITLLNESVRKSDPQYLNAFNSAQRIYNEFEGIIHVNQNARTNERDTAKRVQATFVDEQSSRVTQRVDDNTTTLAQIKNLADMHSAGILTDDEFNVKKKLLLDKLQ